MPLIELNIPNGVYKNGTDLQSSGRWNDANLVRWHEDALRPVGGWRERQSVDISGTARTAISWIDNSGDRLIAAGTHDALYAISAAGVVSDITPTGLTAGRVDAGVNNAYGGGLYGYEEYGVARQDSATPLDATIWTLDNWGEYLLAMSTPDQNNGILYEWQLDTATEAAVVANAPVDCSGFMVTEERFVVCLGAGGIRNRIQWSDQEDNTSWTPAATNQAGDINLQTNGKIMRGMRARGQSLLLTSEDAHTLTYQGPPFVFGVEKVGSACGLIATNAAASVGGNVFWMGRRGFFLYSGGGVQSVECEVGDYVFSGLNYDQKSKISCVVNSAWNEIWWFYPSEGSVECDRYVAYDYAENIWSIGQLGRVSGVDRGVFAQPMYFDSAGVLYEHEIGFNYDGELPFAETGPMKIGSGDNLMNVVQLIPDEKTQGEVQARFKSRFYPNAAETDYGPFTMDTPTSVRLQGRQIRMRVEGNASEDWRVGIMRLDARQGGRR